MSTYDKAVLKCFLEQQSKLFPEEDVAATMEEADEFLEDVMAVVAENAKEVYDYFEEEGIDMEGASTEELLQADEVFAVGDGRYLIVEA